MPYMFSDGVTDQFGGREDHVDKKHKKFTSSRLRSLLEEIYQLPMKEQKQIIQSTLAEWQGDLPQTDDMLLVGIRA